MDRKAFQLTCLGLGFLRHNFVNTPSPTSTLDGTNNGYSKTLLQIFWPWTNNIYI